MSDSLWPRGLQNTGLLSPPLSPGVCSNSCPLSRWCHPTISSSVVPFSSCPQSFPASGSFPMSQFFTSGSQSIGISASASVLPMNTQDWFPLGLVWSPCSPRDSQESSPTAQFKGINFSMLSFLYGLTHIHWVIDAIQLSHPLLSPSLSAFNLSQHQGLFQWVSSSHQVAKVLELQLHH